MHSNASSVEDLEHHTSKGSHINARAVSLGLDLVFNGPFAFIEQDDDVLVALPDIPDHNPPVASCSGDGAHIPTLKRDKYDFTKGIHPADKTSLVTPVAGTSLLSVTGSAEFKSNPYLTIKLPVPRQIVPWNADPLQVSTFPHLPPQTPSRRLATLTVLRYDSDGADEFEIKGSDGKPIWKPIASPLGTERLITFHVTPVMQDDDHVHAHNAFMQLVGMFGLKWDIGFPVLPKNYKRNVPLNPDLLPDDLVSWISYNGMSLMGTHGDCMAPALLVTK